MSPDAGVRPVATSTSSASITGVPSPPSTWTRTGPPVVGRSTWVTDAPVHTTTPCAARPASTAAAANGSTRPSSRGPRSTIVTSSLPSDRHAVASSHATGPPPSTTSRRGAASALVASRLVHGAASARPGIGGSRGAVPVATTTACSARMVTVPPSGRSTSTVRSPARRPWPAGQVDVRLGQPLDLPVVGPVAGEVGPAGERGLGVERGQ